MWWTRSDDGNLTATTKRVIERQQGQAGRSDRSSTSNTLCWSIKLIIFHIKWRRPFHSYTFGQKQKRRYPIQCCYLLLNYTMTGEVLLLYLLTGLKCGAVRKASDRVLWDHIITSQRLSHSLLSQCAGEWTHYFYINFTVDLVLYKDDATCHLTTIARLPRTRKLMLSAIFVNIHVLC